MIDKKKVAAALGEHYLWFLPCCEACHDMRHSSCAGAGVCEDFGAKVATATQCSAWPRKAQLSATKTVNDNTPSHTVATVSMLICRRRGHSYGAVHAAWAPRQAEDVLHTLVEQLRLKSQIATFLLRPRLMLGAKTGSLAVRSCPK